ncbi:hypothetical protein, partial [Streptomyces sp. SID4985]|uniref:hypothetical protein n=1 Tax=Streptomyces sp. SID4985 TaxID=2690292 RepID=UPI001F32D086
MRTGRLPQGPRRLREGRARGHQVVHQDDPSGVEQPCPARRHLQGTGQVLPPLPRVQPRLVQDRPPLPQDGRHP